MATNTQSKLIKQVTPDFPEDGHSQASAPEQEPSAACPSESAYPLVTGADQSFWYTMYAAKIAEAKAIYKRYLGGEPRCRKCKQPW